MHLIKHRQMKKRIFGSLLMGFLTVSAMGQVSKTLSPYSQFGLGTASMSMCRTPHPTLLLIR